MLKVNLKTLTVLLASVMPAIATAQSAPLSVAMHYTQEQAAPLIACLNDYDADGVTAEYQQISYGDYLQTVLTGRLAGQAPDIYNVYSIWAAQMVDNGVLAKPPGEVDDFVRDGYSGGTVDAATIDGTLWGVPTEVSVYMLVSNMALLRDAGYDAPPSTWDELRDMAKAITTRNNQDRIDKAGFAFAKSSSGAGLVHPFYALMYSEGEMIYSDDRSSANFDSAAAIGTANLMADMVEDGITDLTVDAYDFPAGGIGMMMMANWYESAIREGFGDRFDDDVMVSPIPMGDDWKTMQYAFFMGVDSGSDQVDASWDLVEYLNAPRDGGPSCMAQMLDGLGALTASTADTAALPEADAFTAPFVAALADENAISQPNVMQASEIEGMLAKTLEEVMSGDTDSKTALTELNSDVEEILFEFY